MWILYDFIWLQNNFWVIALWMKVNVCAYRCLPKISGDFRLIVEGCRWLRDRKRKGFLYLDKMEYVHRNGIDCYKKKLIRIRTIIEYSILHNHSTFEIFIQKYFSLSLCVFCTLLIWKILSSIEFHYCIKSNFNRLILKIGAIQGLAGSGCPWFLQVLLHQATIET